MSKGFEPLKAREMAKRWQVLAEGRLRYLMDLQRSGRWKRYYNEPKFAEQVTEAKRQVRQWAALSGVPSEIDDTPIAPLREAAE